MTDYFLLYFKKYKSDRAGGFSANLRDLFVGLFLILSKL